MTQWDQLQQLDSVYLQSLDELYSRDEFPMDVRHYLAPWIEGQNWNRAYEDVSLASVLFQVLLENLDIQHSRFVQEGESFLLQRNFRRFKQNFQKYQEQPCILAGIISWFLNKEQEILRSAQVAEQVQQLQVQQSPTMTDSQRMVDCKMLKLQNNVQEMEHNVKSLEEQQDEFDFKFKTRMMEGNISEEEKMILQVLLNKLDSARKKLLATMGVVLDMAEEQLVVLVREELVAWQRRQQKACIGAPEDVSLSKLESWFTIEAECLFQLRKFLKKVEELFGKVTYENDPFKTQKPVLQVRVDTLLTELLKSAFVVETQPSMSQGKGPLVLRTSVQFSVKTRLLVKVAELNHSMKVEVSINGDISSDRRCRLFNIFGNSSRALNLSESMNGGMVADFRHLTLKERKKGGGKGMNNSSLSVTEELHIISFQTEFELHGLSVTLKASSLPVVIISNSSQQQSAWASVLWFNMLCSDPKNIGFFASTPGATWSQMGEMLSWQFLSTTKRGLNSDQLDMLFRKLSGRQENYDTCRISWAKFVKESLPDTNFSFWVWFDGILTMVKKYLEDLWNDGCIMGFVSRGKEKALLKKKQTGTFLLRFSESVKDGGITFSWVEYFSDGKPNVRTVHPFTQVDLSQIPFPEIIRYYKILESENVPENPLKFLYPNIPKDEAFGKYYIKKCGAEAQYLKYIKTRFVVVTTKNPLEPKANRNLLAETDSMELLNGPCDSKEAAAPEENLLPSDDLMNDLNPSNIFSPALQDELLQALLEEQSQTLQEVLPQAPQEEFLLNDPMMTGAHFLSAEESVFPTDISSLHVMHAPLFS